MINLNKLKGKMAEKGFNLSKLADCIGINRATLYRKLMAGGIKLTIAEVKKIAITLNLDIKELNEIFFALYVA